MSGSMAFLDDDNCVDDLVADCLCSIMECVDRHIDRAFAATVDAELTADIVMKKLRRLVAWSVFSHDGCVEGVGLEVDEPSHEPAPLTGDAWARGIVPVKKIEISPLDLLVRGRDGDMIGTPHSMSSTMSASSNMSASTGSFSARSRRSRMPTPSKPAPIDPTGKIYSIDIDVQNDAIVNPELNQMIKALRKAALQEAKLKNANRLHENQQNVSSESNHSLEPSSTRSLDRSKQKDRLPARSVPLKPAISSNQSLGRKSSMRSIATTKILEELFPNKGTPSKVSQALGVLKKFEDREASFLKQLHEITPKTRLSLDHSVTSSDTSSQQPSASQDRPISAHKVIKPSQPIKQTISAHSEKTNKSNSNSNFNASNGKKSPASKTQRPRKILRPAPTMQSTTLPYQSAASQMSHMNPNPSQPSTDLAVTEDFSRSSILLPETMTTRNNEIPLQALVLEDIDAFQGARKIRIIDDDSPSNGSQGNHSIGPMATSGHFSAIALPAKLYDDQIENTRMMFSGGHRPKDRDFIKNMKATVDRRHLPPPPLGRSTGHGSTGYPSIVNGSAADTQSHWNVPSLSQSASKEPSHSRNPRNGVIKVRRQVTMQ